MTAELGLSRRVSWSERWPRPSHELSFTVLGSRPRKDSLAGLDAADIRLANRYLSQIAIALPRGSRPVADTDIDYWVTVCRKILQRGVRPPVSPRIDEELPVVAAYESRTELAHMLTAARLAPQIDSSYELHPRWERPFWDEACRIAPRAASWLIPQAPLEALISGETPAGVGRRWVDFLYAPPGRRPIVFEIDGRDHVRRPDADRERDRQLGAAGIQVSRLAGAESLSPSASMLSMLLADENAFAADSRALGSLTAAASASRLALAVVEAVRLGLLDKGGSWSLEVVDSEDFAETVAGPALDPLYAVSELWRLGVVPSSVQVNGRVWLLSDRARRAKRTPERLPPTVRIRLEHHTPYYAPLSAAADVPEITVRNAAVPVDLEWLTNETRQRRRLGTGADTELHLRLLLEDIFGHGHFRDGQLASLLQALRGGDSVVLLPTGTGKSLIYQLAGLLTPGTTVVVDPLVSLIDDQERGLKQNGFDRVAAIHSSKAGGLRETEQAIDAVDRGEPQFLFVTPERFQSQKFRDRLQTTASRTIINLAVIDEAHTVSEWGHDFRTSYLRLARNIRRICRDSEGGWPPVLALTGTAGPAVLRDVLRELEIDGEADGALQRPASHDRPNLHYHKISGDDGQWLALVQRAITDTVPDLLKVDVSELADRRGPSTLSGIVFCPWARGEHGVERVRDAVVNAMSKAGVTLAAGVYSGRSSSGEENPRWATEKAEVAANFKENVIPLLVATKAFGMGIDKPNIRYTVHAGFPSSIEAFAQEAGRAGRDGQESYCILTAALPTPDVARSLLDRSLTHAERRERAKFTRRAESGDLGRQLFFYGSSFPGPEEEAELGTKLYAWFKDRGGKPGGRAVISITRRPNEKEGDYAARKGRYDRAMYRLALLGIIDDITVDGPEHTAHFSEYDGATADHALLSYLSRIEPGNEATHRRLVDSSPPQLDDRIAAHLQTLAEAVYRIVAAARLTAIENMYDLARGSDEPQHLRDRLNSYLGDGTAAVVLAEGIAMSPIDVPRFVALLETIPAAETAGLMGAAARQREAYPDHPLLWLATALSVAREPASDQARFTAALRRSLETFSSYEVPPAQAAAGMGWLMDRLRTENSGARWEWNADILESWDAADLGIEYLEDAEDDALRLARQGQYREVELAAVIRRRFRRRALESSELAARYAGSGRRK